MQKVKEAVDGTLLDVRPAKNIAASGNDAEQAGGGVGDGTTEETTKEPAETDQPPLGTE